ncbi:SoxR (2Fe-2S) reducing system protein RsxE [Gammaproteobacteria bacterium]
MIAEPSLRHVAADGLWLNNQVLVALLGLCPSLAVTTSAVNGLGIGLATLLVLVGSNTTVSLIRHWVRPEVRITVFIVIIAAFVTTVQLIVKAWFYELDQVLGIYIPLIVVNCQILGRAEAFASRHTPLLAFTDGLFTGLGTALILTLLGAVRELAGQGTLFDQAQRVFGDFGRHLTLSLGADFQGALVALLPPGAFFALAILVVASRHIETRRKTRPVNGSQWLLTTP